MIGSQGKRHGLSASGRYEWRVSSVRDRRIMRLRENARYSGDARNGQVLAGTGALVFEGELIELPRRSFG